MTNISEICDPGINPAWPSRKSFLEWADKMEPWDMEQAVAYNLRQDYHNKMNTLPTASYDPVGYREGVKAVALALRGFEWRQLLANALGYQLFGDRLKYFWHHQFRILFPTHPRPLRSVNWTGMTETMAMAFWLGWTSEGAYQGALILSVLENSFQLRESYELQHRRGHVFMVRLVADWLGRPSPSFPPYGYDEPIYEGLLERWRDADLNSLVPWVKAACNRHTFEALPDTEEEFYDFANSPCIPLEILLLFRLREAIGLENPLLTHPLLDAPFDQLPLPAQPYVPDDLMKGTLARVQEDWPEFQRMTSLENL